MLALTQRLKYGNVIVEVNKFIEQKTYIEISDVGLAWQS